VTVKARVMRKLAHLALARPVVGLLGRKRQQGPDDTLDPQIAAVLELQRMLKLPSLDSMPPAKARAFAERGLSYLDVESGPMAEVIDTRVGSIPVRMFVPPGASDHGIVYFHGGGGVIGSVRSSEPVTRYLAERTRCTVASVEYRLGPEHKHPAAIEDAVEAFEGLRSRFAGRVAVAGDSFGGFLSAHVSRIAKPRPDLQVLIYPMTDPTMGLPSLDRNAEGYLLTRSMVQWFRAHYFRDTDDRRAAAPRFWTDLRGNVPAIVVTAGYDPLVDEGDAFADALKAAGVSVVHRRYPSLIHSFLSLAGGVTTARQAIDEMCRDIEVALAA
jgi:acetyl esterase